MPAPARSGRGDPAGWPPAPAAARPAALVDAPEAPRRRHAIRAASLGTLAGAALAAGYADLARGGTSLGAVLVVLGYCALVPAAVLASAPAAEPFAPPPFRRTRVAAPAAVPDPERARAPYAAAAVASLAVLALYVATLAPTAAMWDASEYIAVAKVLGLPHPPGNPLFVLLGHVFGLLPLPVSYAERINLLAALSSALAAGCWFLIAERTVRDWIAARWARLAVAGAASLVGATAFTVWNQSVVNEKVYTVSLFGVALVSWLMIRWADAPEGPRADRLLVLCAYLAGLGYAVHPAGLLVGPAAVAFVLARRPATLLRWRLLLGLGGALALGVTPFAFEPIRAAHQPPINEGEPTACRDGIAWSCTFSRETLDRLMANVNREQYGGHPVLERKAPFAAQLDMWWLYFQWQWLRDAYDERPALRRALGVAFLALGLGGAWVHWRRGRATFWYFAPLVATLTVALVFYLNFNYGWSQAPELGDAVPREVRDRDYFYIWGFSAWGVWVALALAAAWRALAARVASDARGEPSGRGWALAAPVLLVALVPLAGNAGQASRAGQTFTREWAVDLLNSVEPYGVLVTNGDNDSFPLWYAQHVEGVRRDVTVALVPYLGLDFYIRQLNRQPPAEYDAARGPALYRGRAWRRPTSPLVRMTDAEADAVPPYVVASEPQRFVHGGIDATVPAGVLTRDQLLVLRIIKDSFPERPLYFSGPSYPQALGLEPYVVGHGLAYRLTTDSVAAGPARLRVPGGHLDVPRTLALWEGVYRGQRALVREGDWVDRASVGIPLAYAVTGQQLAVGLAQAGDSARAARVMDAVEAVARAARLGRAE